MSALKGPQIAPRVGPLLGSGVPPFRVTAQSSGGGSVTLSSIAVSPSPGVLFQA